jgi:DNA-binding PadR family transcriptional regulator
MTEFGDLLVEPKRGRKPLPVNLGTFVRDYFLEHGKGTQRDIHAAYKEALREAYEESGVRFTRFSRMKYHSFLYFFSLLKQLGWVEPVGEEKSKVQEHYPSAPPRVFYQLTAKGRAASEELWQNPRQVLYPHFDSRYYSEKSRQYRAERRAKGLPPYRPV